MKTYWELEHIKFMKNKKLKQKGKTYYDIHKKEIKEKYIKNKLKKDYQKNYIRKYNKLRRKKDIIFKLLYNYRIRLRTAIKNNFKSEHTIKLLGCSIQQLRKHLEKQFRPGMSWQNYGKWHIDHIRPCYKFDLSKAKEQKLCFNWKNLRPLWAKENLTRKKK